MTSTVVCDYANAGWEVNSLGQNACQVYAELQGVCNSGFTIGSVVATSPPYTPPNNDCGCNVVAYNLMAGCGWCQSQILTTWWLTESQWAGNCTASTFDATGLPTSVNANNIAFPAWALVVPTGTTWSPTQAQLAAASASPSAATAFTTAAATANNGGASTPNGAIGTSPPHSTSTFIYYSGGDDNLLNNGANDAGKSAGIAVGVILGLYALAAIAIIAVYFIRQNQRKAWYGPMGQYYANLRAGGAAQPLMYNGAGMPYDTAKTPMSNTSGSQNYNYQPPPPEPQQAAYDGYIQPGYGAQPGYGQPNTNSMYGAPGGAPNTHSMYGAPPTGAPSPSPAGYKGYAEAH